MLDIILDDNKINKGYKTLRELIMKEIEYRREELKTEGKIYIHFYYNKKRRVKVELKSRVMLKRHRVKAVNASLSSGNFVMRIDRKVFDAEGIEFDLIHEITHIMQALKRFDCKVADLYADAYYDNPLEVQAYFYELLEALKKEEYYKAGELVLICPADYSLVTNPKKFLKLAHKMNIDFDNIAIFKESFKDIAEPIIEYYVTDNDKIDDEAKKKILKRIPMAEKIFGVNIDDIKI